MSPTCFISPTLPFHFLIRFLSFYVLIISILSIPDADIVCSRAKIHYTPDVDLSDAGSNVGEDTLQRYIDAYQPLHAQHLTKMHFMVSGLVVF
jgi:hypothetical protein